MATLDKLLLSPADHGRVLTLDEFLEADEEPGYRYELARGVLEVTIVPNDPHGEVVCNLYRAISRSLMMDSGVVASRDGSTGSENTAQTTARNE